MSPSPFEDRANFVIIEIAHIHMKSNQKARLNISTLSRAEKSLKGEG